MKVLTIVGARPQFVKAAAVSPVLRRRHTEILVHTGQHYDYTLSAVFFEGLGIPRPDINLNVGSASHAVQTADMLPRIEQAIIEAQPDCVLVYGDTNSTLAGALAAAKLGIPLVHVEAGLRSFNMAMPEEVNRILTDRVSRLLLCPTQTAVDNLHAEGIRDGVCLVGDVMFDIAARSAEAAGSGNDILRRLTLTPGEYVLATIHRAENTDDPACLSEIVYALAECNQRVVLPLHPRTTKCLETFNLLETLRAASNVVVTEPLAYLDFVCLLRNARLVLTDSGGVQKEACFHRIPCVTLREETEWVETLESGWNLLTGANKQRILLAMRIQPTRGRRDCAGMELWDGRAAERVMEQIESM